MGRPKKYKTEEERKAARREYDKQRYLDNREEKIEYQKQWREDNPDYNKQWREDNKEHIAEYNKQYRDNNKEHIADYRKQYYLDNRESELEYRKEYRETSIGRANYLLGGYRRNDEYYNRGECTLTAEWIVENIFTKPCHYCGETDWRKLGCDRVDNALPHTADNVVPCCADCNRKKARYAYDDYMEMIANSP